MKVLLLAGGDSAEREVSLASGQAVFEVLISKGQTVLAIDPCNGRSLLSGDNKFIDFESYDSSIKAVSSDARAFTNSISFPGFSDVEVVFVALHGGSGENGRIQCLLEMAGKKYTGSGMAASAIAMDKAISKRLAESEKIPTPPWQLLRLRSDGIDRKLLDQISRKFDLPIIVKPNDSGSTIGLTRVQRKEELENALEVAVGQSSNIIVEQYMAGREMTVAVLDGHPFPVVEIKPKGRLYDYEAKYKKGMSEYIVPAEINKSVAAAMSAASVKISKVIGTSGLVRVDFIMTENNDFYFLELNTLPGLTDLSLAPMAAAAEGIRFDDLVMMIIESALKP